MSHTTPIPLPLMKGLDGSTDPATGSDLLAAATDVDFSLDGVVRGRPGREAPKNFIKRVTTGSNYPLFSSPGAFSTMGFTAAGLHRLRDHTGERAALSTHGRLFVQDGTRWIDRGPHGCMKVERSVLYKTGLTTFPATVRRDAVAQDFGRVTDALGAANGTYGLTSPSGTIDIIKNVNAIDYTSGNSARCGTTTAVVVHNVNFLDFIYRTNGADTLSATQLATDGATPADDGDAASICCSADATQFWVAYLTTTVNQYKVLRVSITGSVLATFTGTFAGIAGIWVDNLSVAADKVVVAITGTAGLRIKTLNATAMTDTSTDSDVAVGPGEDVVVGRESDTRVWWAYRQPDASVGTLRIGTATPNSAGSALTYRVFYGDVASLGSGSRTADPRWSIAHQPILVGGRVYLTLGCSVIGPSGTWITLDLSNWRLDSNSTGPFKFPTPVARGPADANVHRRQPSSATVLPDGTGWTFASLEWTRFFLSSGGASGTQATLGVNKVTFSQPRAAQFGEGTVFSGSVPFYVSQGQSAELGFPFLSGVPGLDVVVAAGGTLGVGTFQVVACWVWTDDTGVLHRSAPSAQRPVTTSGGNLTIKAYVTNPWLHAKEYGTVKLELYVSQVGLTIPILQQTVEPNFNDGYTEITISSGPFTSQDTLYTVGGGFPNVHVPGDGGVAAVGRRLWLASDNRVWASKLRIDGIAPEFSDSAGAGGIPPLSVDLPPGAGRVVALEHLDDKLIILCERGVFVVPDGGPDNVGVGPDFASPFKLSDLGVAGPRSSCWTDKGVVFSAPLNATDPGAGGPWLVDRGLKVDYLGRPPRGVLTKTGSYVPEVAFSPERQQFFQTFLVGSTYGLAMFDMRVGKWAKWTVTGLGNLQSHAVVAGALWTLCDNPAEYTRVDGTDSGAGNITMTITTSHIPGNGKSGLGWSKVRSAKVLGTQSSGTHTLAMSAVLDQAITLTRPGLTVNQVSPSTKWPTNRQAEEWRLPQQKCSTIQMTLTATPAIAEWVAIELQVLPLPTTAPAKSRS